MPRTADAEPTDQHNQPLATLVNGQAGGLVSVLERGLQFGDGLFSTLAVCAGRALCLEAHLSRLQRGAARLGMASDSAAHALREDISCLLTDSSLPRRAVLKIILSRGLSGRGYQCPQPEALTRIVSLFPWPEWPGRPRQEGIVAQFCHHRLPWHSALAGIKHLNRLDQVLARRELPAQGVAEGLMLDRQGWVVSGIMSNVFLRHQRLWHTPDLRHCGVAGIMREQVLACLGRLRWPVQVGRVLPGDIAQADELFFCNSLIGIWPLRRLGGQRFQDFSGSQRLLQELQAADAIV